MLGLIRSQYPRQCWLRICSRSLGVALWLPTAPQGWVTCRELYTVYVTNKVPLIIAKADFESDFELEDEAYHTEPYLSDPEYTEEELCEREAARARQAGFQPAVAEYPQTPRTEDARWCICGHCTPMASEDECLRCR